MDKEILLRLLDDDDVRQKILYISAAENPPAQNPVAQDKISALESEIMFYEQRLIDASNKISKLESTLRDVTAERNSASNQLQAARVENYQLKTDLSKAAQREKNYLAESNELEKNIQRLETKNSQLKKSFDDLQKKFADFERGWQLFQDYQRVGSNTRQILKTGVFPRDDFTSFICAAAQPDSLEFIWDVVRECVLAGNNSDADILWRIFEYAIALVNSSRAQATYSILPVSVGDRFDPDFHREGPDSRAQGNISAVFIRGFRNDYNRRVIRKSIVRVS